MHVVPEGAAGVIEGGTGAGSGGGVSFVAFRPTNKFYILDDESTRLLITCVSLTMVTITFFEDMGGKIAKKLE